MATAPVNVQIRYSSDFRESLELGSVNCTRRATAAAVSPTPIKSDKKSHSKSMSKDRGNADP
jgi:hypothetical protein